MRCQALMTELYRHVGARTIDVPAGDIGVGGREVGFMAGMMRKSLLQQQRAPALFTGKGLLRRQSDLSG